MDPKAVLATIKEIRAKQAGIITKEKADVLAAINAALADPAKAYEQALESTEPKNTPTPTPSANRRAIIVDPRRKLGDELRNQTFVNGLRLQLAYLSLTWQHYMGVRVKELIPALLDYTSQVNGSYDELSTLEMFHKSLQESVFTTYFQVGPYINGLPAWSDHPFDTETIFQQTLLPEMRKDKDPRLLEYWDTHLATEAARATASGNALAITKFNHVRRPSLLWSRAEDQLILGNNDQGVAAMLALLKANPDHPDFESWASQLEGIVNAKAVPPGDVVVGPATLVTPDAGSLGTYGARRALNRSYPPG